MVHNRQRQLWFCRNRKEEPPKWQLLSCGLLQRNVSTNSRKIRFYALGQEQYPKEEVQNTVKVLTFLLDYAEADQAQQEILQCHGETVSIVQWELAKNGESKGKICDALVEVLDDGSGGAMEPVAMELRFTCGWEQDAEIVDTVNGISFTVKKKEVSGDE